MPIPTPAADETHDEFIARCHRALADEFTDPAQRHAVCEAAWRAEQRARTRKSLKVSVADEAQGLVEAVIATFGVVDSDGDLTLPEAFQDGAPVRLSAYGHTSWLGALPVGRGELRVTPTEARFRGRFFLETTAGRETFATVQAMGDLQEWSYGFDVLETAELTPEFRALGARRVLKRVRVHEVSPVLVGAGVGTRTVAVKAADPTAALRGQILVELARFERTRARLLPRA
ncbi:MAG TPA: HK97 family phage prohead protease [Gaiellaceae bacterium]|nr:HK97 family phage prohead protease [Gaiellaceae bacterium]